jgi:UDP-glucose 4-epimerase
VDATVLAMDRADGMYNVGGGVEASLREAIGVLERLAGRSLQIRDHPAVPGDQRRTNADTTRIRSELGWSPEITLEDGLRAQWEWASSTVSAP